MAKRERTHSYDAAWFAGVLDAMSELVLVKGANSRLLWANESFLEHYGMSNAELHGLIDAEHSNPDDTLQYVRDDRQVFTTGEVLQVSEPISNSEGDVSYWDTVKTPVWDEAGAVVRTVGVSRPIEGARAEEAAEDRIRHRAAMELFRSVVAATPTAMLVVDRVGKVIFANARAETLFGYPERAFVGMDVEDLVPVGVRERHVHLREAFLETPVSRSMGEGLELEGVRADGTHIPVEIGLNPLTIQGAAAVLVSIEDVAVRRAKERELRRVNAALKESNTDLEQFAYVASHDLKSPLRAISSLSTWLTEDLGEDLSDESGHLLQLLQGRVERMSKLLEDLLAYSLAGRDEYARDLVDCASLVESIGATISVPPGFDLACEGELPVFTTERTPLEIVLRNLIQNAVKHHDREEGRIRVSCREAEGRWEFSVVDDGPGIGPAFYERVFKIFQTLKPRDEVEGSGMGLALIRRLVHRYQGKIEIQPAIPSDPAGRGTRVVFTWPA